MQMNRRRFARSLLEVAGAPFAASLAGGCGIFQRIADTCPEDPDESGGVTWVPDVMHPVFYGFQELTPSHGAPTTLRIWYPTYEGFTDGPPILKLCIHRFPVVVFFHGQQPCPPRDTEYYRRWTMLPAVLARSGYVVIVPRWNESLPAELPTALLDLPVWVRTGWEHQRWVDRRPEATAFAGHSFGAILAARMAQTWGDTGAYVGLSGPWDQVSGGRALIRSIGAPSFIMWGRDLFFEDLDVFGNLWPGVPGPKVRAVFDGEHFDYIPDQPSCGEPRGPCSLIPAAAADLAALFLTRYMPPALATSTIPASLVPPAASLTTEQQFFAGGRLGGITGLEEREGCRIDLGWEDGAETGSRSIGPG